MRNFSRDYLPNADALVEYLAHFARSYDLKIDYGQTVTNVERVASDQRFKLATGAGATYLCKTVVVATGLSTPDVPAFKGVEHLVTYDKMSVNPSRSASRSPDIKRA